MLYLRNKQPYNLRETVIFKVMKNEGYKILSMQPVILEGFPHGRTKCEGVCVAIMASQDRGPAVHRIFISGFFKRLRSLVYRKTQKEKKYIFEANNYKIKEKNSFYIVF